MSVIRDPDRIIAAWLATGPSHLSEATRQAIAEGARSTPQVRRGVTPREGIGRYQVLGLAAAVATIALVSVVLAIGSERPTDREPTPQPSAPVVTATAFESPLYGYSIDVLEGWDVAPATTHWMPGDRPRREAADRFDLVDATGARPQFSVVEGRLRDGTAPEAWLASSVPSRYEGRGATQRCAGFASTTGSAPDVWRPTSLAGRSGWRRESCGAVDGVLPVDGRAYVFSALGAFVFHGATAETQALFDRLVDSFQPGPDLATFTSAVYGYSIAYQAECAVVPATEPWVPGEKLWAGPQGWGGGPHVDKFCGEEARFTVAATELPDGVTLADWVADLRPHVAGVCRAANGWLFEDRGFFAQSEVAGLPGYQRSACGSVDGVVVIDGRAYVMTYDGPNQRGGSVAAFRAFVDTIKFGTRPPATPPESSPRRGIDTR
jgi:hypothetical protein